MSPHQFIETGRKQFLRGLAWEFHQDSRGFKGIEMLFSHIVSQDRAITRQAIGSGVCEIRQKRDKLDVVLRHFDVRLMKGDSLRELINRLLARGYLVAVDD